MRGACLVDIPVTSSDTSEGQVVQQMIEFGSGNWNSPQTVTVMGRSDTPPPRRTVSKNIGFVPLEHVAALVERPVSSVRFFTNRYVASREAVLRRMVQLGNRPAALVFLSRRLSPTERGKSQTKPLFADFDAPVPKMRILYAVGSDFPIFLPPDKSVPDTSCVYSADQIDEAVVQEETWELAGFGNWRVEAMALPVPMESEEDAPTVAALVLP